MNTLTVSRDELCRRFWEEIQPGLSQLGNLEMEATVRTMAGGVQSGQIGDLAVAETMAKSKELSDEVEERVKRELYHKAVMHFSSPTRFALLYHDSMVKHYVDVKRRRLGPKAKYPLRGFEGHDVEADIEQTAKEIKRYEQLFFPMERQFFAAMEEGRLNDAQSLLSSIEILRRNADETLRNEVRNWRFELACVKGDVDMFFEACQKVPVTAHTDLEILHMLLEKLLYRGVIRGAFIQLSAEGLRAAARAGKNQQEFGTDQAALFLRSAIKEVGELVIAGSCTSATDFRRRIMLAFERSRKSSLAVNPYIASLNVAWK